jgi:hypothetical protein
MFYIQYNVLFYSYVPDVTVLPISSIDQELEQVMLCKFLPYVFATCMAVGIYIQLSYNGVECFKSKV